MSPRNKPGRPAGDKRRSILERTREQPSHARQLAVDLRLSMQDVYSITKRMVNSAELRIVRKERVEWSARPVSVFAPNASLERGSASSTVFGRTRRR